MPKYKVEHQAPIDSANAFEKIKTLLNGENDFRKFDPSVTFSFNETKKICQIMGNQYKADLQILEKDSHSSKINIEIELSITLSIFKGKILEVLEKNLKQILI